jgi:quercetin dioxygenase-like cupin family protein
MREELTQIKKLAKSLSENISEKRHGYSLVNTDNAGTSIFFNLLNIPEIAISRTFISNGTIFPYHSHREKEWVLVYKGELEVCQDDACYTLHEGEIAQIESDIKHSAKALSDTWIIAIIVPQSPEWPSGDFS